ncbi:MAG: hypothetical protein ACTSVY_12035 [Candidatus Helarchaeota archaeon]
MLFFNYKPLSQVDDENKLEQIAELYHQTWYKTGLNTGTYSFEPKFIEYWIKTYCDEDFTFTSYKEDKLIGILLGKSINLHVRIKPKSGLVKKETLRGLFIGGAAIAEKFQRSNHMRNMFDALISLIQSKNYDLVLTVPNTDSGIVIPLKNNLEFEIYNKKANSFIGFLNDERLRCQEEIQGKDILSKITETLTKPIEFITGPLITKSLKTSLKKLRHDEFQEAKESDYLEIVEILNGYNQKIELNRVWTLDEFRKYVNGSMILREMEKEEPGKYGFHVKVWKDDGGEIIGFATLSKRKTFYNGGILPTVYIDLFGFKQHLIVNDKIKFFTSVFEEILNYKPDVCSVIISGCYHELELINQLNFRPVDADKHFMILKFSDKAEIINELKSIENFNIPIIDF